MSPEEQARMNITMAAMADVFENDETQLREFRHELHRAGLRDEIRMSEYAVALSVIGSCAGHLLDLHIPPGTIRLLIHQMITTRGIFPLWRNFVDGTCEECRVSQLDRVERLLRAGLEEMRPACHDGRLGSVLDLILDSMFASYNYVVNRPSPS